MDRRERELVQFIQGCTLYGNAEADESIVHNIAPVTLSGVLTGAADCQMTHIGQVLEGVDKGRHIGGRVKQGRVLLSEHIAEAGVAILWPAQGRSHMGVGRIEKADLVARDWVYQRGQEGTFRVGKSKSQVLDVVSDPRQGLNP